MTMLGSDAAKAAASHPTDGGKLESRSWKMSAFACALSLSAALVIAASLTLLPKAEVAFSAIGEPSMPAYDFDDEFPFVDWDGLRAIDPNVIGWVSIPGTDLGLPIVRANASEPSFYASHGFGRSADAKGCPFLDSDCTDGLNSLNSVVYGHNWSTGEMFAEFAKYARRTYAEKHRKVLLQTPDVKRRLYVQSVEIASGMDSSNVMGFSSREEFRCWYQARYEASIVKLAPKPTGDAAPDKVVTFCTCVDDETRDERVLVYAAEG